MKGRVLVVSADPARRRTFRDNLFLAGHVAFDALNRSTALEACEDFNPSVAVIDLAGSARRAKERAERGKPCKTSVDCKLVRQIASRFPSVRIIAFCDSEEGPSPQAAVEAGAHDYLKEPVCIGELLVRVDKHLGISTNVKKLSRPSSRPRRKIILRYPASDAVLELAKELADFSANDPSQTETALYTEAQGEGLSPLDPSPSDSANSARACSEMKMAEPDRPDQYRDSSRSLDPQTPARPGSPLLEQNSVSSPELVREKDQAGPARLADLVSAEHATQSATMAWVSLQGLDRAANFSLVMYEAISTALNPVIDSVLPNSSKWWAGSEAVVVVSEHVASPVETAIELKSAIAKTLESLGVSDQIALRVQATTRRWGEGRAIFLARATGRISNGSLPVSVFEPASRPHPVVTLPSDTARIKSGANWSASRIGSAVDPS